MPPPYGVGRFVHVTNIPDPTTVEALGKISEALETVERARGHLYSFHQLSGSADLALQEGVAKLREAGHDELAEEISAGLVGRNVLPDRWTFQIVEEYDDGYWSVFREYENKARQLLAGGRRHLFEANMKDDERAGKNPEAQTRPPRYS
jgi:hypothetical protein